MPLKQKDPGAFTIPCVIGNAGFKRVLCDLGASISVMPKHVYNSLSLEPLNKTSIVIQLADRSFVYPLGVIENVLVVITQFWITSKFCFPFLQKKKLHGAVLNGTVQLLPCKCRDRGEEGYF